VLIAGWRVREGAFAARFPRRRAAEGPKGAGRRRFGSVDASRAPAGFLEGFLPSIVLLLFARVRARSWVRDFVFPGRKMHYRNKWYADLGEAPLLFALGIHGQYVFVDRRNQLVIVMMSSQADPLDAEMISLTMTAVSHFREIFALS
jgi:hypothetical protein